CVFLGCGEKAPKVGDNLLRNGSFESVGGELPKHWEITNFRGLQDMEASVYGVTDSVAYDGERSFFFKAAPTARRFYTLAQEVRVRGAKRVRVRGAIMGVGVGDHVRQYPQANFALTYYGPDRERFESARFADVRTNPNYGSTDGWIQIDHVFRLPLNTEFVVLHCVLGLEGAIWFDDVSLEVPVELPWQTSETENFVHHWLEEPYPEGSRDYQQELFDSYATRLGITPEERVRISYYLYPDTAAFRQTMGMKRGVIHADYKRREIHTVNAVDDHEIIHMLTDPYGVMPTIMNEGTAFYLMGTFDGRSIQPLAQEMLRAGELPELETVLNPLALGRVDPAKMIPAAASFAGYLIEIGGPAKYLELHGQTKPDMAYGGFAQAFRSVYGKTLAETEAAWRRVLDRADFSEGAGPGE
ncbi:MAG: hypothetical protein KAJ37_01695, partial [Candidatus Krumholzibacteria bacterium]|nr:hypothetical protein [Candidatus Krumholzibacteria bacterium]